MAETTESLEEFRTEVRTWLAENFPPSLKGRGAELMGGETIGEAETDALAWGKRMNVGNPQNRGLSRESTGRKALIARLR